VCGRERFAKGHVAQRTTRERSNNWRNISALFNWPHVRESNARCYGIPPSSAFPGTLTVGPSESMNLPERDLRETKPVKNSG
jgi:hypothetical protein